MLSARALAIAPSATLEITNKVLRLRRSGVDIISMNAGEPDFGTPENICRAAVGAISLQRTKYTPVAGIPELREAICDKLAADDHTFYTPEEISVGTGAKQPLCNAVLALCGEGDEVLLPTPCWVSYIEMVKLAGATPVLVPSREEEGFSLNVDAISAAITPRTRAILINTPNNPTGAVYTRRALEQLAELACRHNFFIISDEVYEKLVYDGAEHVCPASLSEDVRRRTVVINGFSKAYAMTGWRVGYAAGDREVIRAINAIQGHATSNTCSVAQYAALEALRGPQDSVEAMRREFDRRRLYLLERLSHMSGVSCANVRGAFYLLPNISDFYGRQWQGKTLKDSFDLANFLLDEAHVAVVPGGAFEAPQHLRIAYSNSMEQLQKGMDRMEATLSKL